MQITLYVFIIASIIYLISIGLTVATKNALSSFIFKVLPIVLAFWSWRYVI